jgi:hypothetical protein
MCILLPFLAACAALQRTSIIALLGATVAANINRLIEVTIHAFNGGVLLSDLFASGNFLKSHPEDFGFLVERVSGVDGKVETLAVEGIWNAVAIVTKSFAKADFALRWKTTLLVGQDEFLATPIGNVTAELHGTGDEKAESVSLPLITKIVDHACKDTTVKVLLNQVLTGRQY